MSKLNFPENASFTAKKIYMHVRLAGLKRDFPNLQISRRAHNVCLLNLNKTEVKIKATGRPTVVFQKTYSSTRPTKRNACPSPMAFKLRSPKLSLIAEAFFDRRSFSEGDSEGGGPVAYSTFITNPKATFPDTRGNASTYNTYSATDAGLL